jgi:hypothetical protein
LAECFTECWGDVFGRGVWLAVGTFLVLEPAVFVEPMLLAIVVSPGPRRPEDIPQLHRLCRVGYIRAVPTIKLTDDELAAVAAAIRRLVDEDKFPRAPRLDPLRAALGKV